MNKEYKNQTHRYNRMMDIRGGKVRRTKWAKRVKYMVGDGNQTIGGEHTQCIQMLNYNVYLKHIMLLTRYLNKIKSF